MPNLPLTPEEWKIEVVAHYPRERKKKKAFVEEKGTIHLYIENLDLDLRGIFYVIKGKKTWIYFPDRKGKDDNGNICNFTVYNFTSHQRQKSFIQAIHKAIQRFSNTLEFKKEKLHIIPKNVFSSKR